MLNDTMIAPALRPAQWAARKFDEISQDQVLNTKYLVIEDGGDRATVSGAEQLRATIALANGLLDDDDPHKLTWAMVDALEEAARRRLSDGGGDAATTYADRGVALRHIARVIASYLPPRGDGA
jgi:hypothetical protein